MRAPLAALGTDLSRSRVLARLGDGKGVLSAAHAARSGWRTGLLLALMCFALYLPGQFTLPAVDRDESRFAQASRQMLESGTLEGWVVPRIQDRPRLNKPPLIYWMQAGSAAALTGFDASRDAIWMYRIPSILAAVVVCLVTWRIGRRLYDARVGALAGAIVAICPIFMWEARQARADMVLVMFTLLGVWALLHAIEQAWSLGRVSWLTSIALWACVGLGVMTKGPATPLVIGLCAIGMAWGRGNWSLLLRLRLGVGLGIVVLMVAPWVYLVAQEVGFENYATLVYDETLGRSQGAKEGHWGPPGYHALLMPLLLFPGSLLTGVGIVWSWQRAFGIGGGGAARSFVQRLRGGFVGRDVELFLLAWIVPAWIVFELVATKLPHYTMPMYPALAVVSARVVLAADSGVFGKLGGAPRIGLHVWRAGMVMLPVGVALAYWFICREEIAGTRGSLWVMDTIIAIALVAFGIVVAARTSLRTGSLTASLRGSLVFTGIFFWVFLTIWQTTLQHVWVTQRILSAIPGLEGRPIASVAYHEDSLIFETRGRLERIDVDRMREWWRDHPRGVLIVPKSDLPDGADTGDVIERSVKGANYANGQVVDLVIIWRDDDE